MQTSWRMQPAATLLVPLRLVSTRLPWWLLRTQNTRALWSTSASEVKPCSKPQVRGRPRSTEPSRNSLKSHTRGRASIGWGHRQTVAEWFQGLTGRTDQAQDWAWVGANVECQACGLRLLAAKQATPCSAKTRVHRKGVHPTRVFRLQNQRLVCESCGG